ncbi:MAG TPA: SRPBCC domain-containing protein [Ilumatobacteraceae bacterium]|jgi:uncharacterized protein YndB with AHSA1/START domain
MTATTAKASVVVKAPRHRVWEALTDPTLIPQYFMGAEIDTDWKVGHPIKFKGEWKGKPFEDKGEILTFEPHREMSYSHWSPLEGKDDVPDNYHVVHIALREVEEGTEVVLDQSNLNGQVTEDDRQHREDYEKNWSGMLAGLKKVAEN